MRVKKISKAKLVNISLYPWKQMLQCPYEKVSRPNVTFQNNSTDT